MANMKTKLGDLVLDNPIIVSSGYATETPEALRKADAFGPGAMILKSSLVEEEYSRLVKPYAPHRFPAGRFEFTACEDGLLMAAAMSPMPLEWWAEWLAKNRKSFKSPIIASVAGISVESYVQGAKLMEQAGAPAVELLLACPAPYFRPFKYSMSADPQVGKEITEAVKSAVSIPVGSKIAPLSVVARSVKQAGADWVTLGGVNLAAPGVDLDTLEPKQPYAFALSGSKVNKYITFHYLISVASISGSCHISAHGGVQEWGDVAEFILYGASSIQAHSIFMLKGFSVIQSLKRGLADYMDKKGFASLDQMRGVILPKLATYDDFLGAYAETQGKVISKVDEALCNGCGICEDVCAFDAIHVVGGVAKVLNSSCEGCNLCVADCPTEAISLENVALLKKQAVKA
ncbi:MAG: 4Fe-4S binding protein [Chloroflexi bacterium]|nr:4Fe-4S binding protein [Chloroflexota bacterium]